MKYRLTKQGVLNLEKELKYLDKEQERLNGRQEEIKEILGGYEAVTNERPLCSYCGNCKEGIRIDDTYDVFKCGIHDLYIPAPKTCKDFINEKQSKTMIETLVDFPAHKKRRLK